LINWGILLSTADNEHGGDVHVHWHINTAGLEICYEWQCAWNVWIVHSNSDLLFSWRGQTVGYGNKASYHANNKFALLSSFVKGFKVLAHIIKLINSWASAKPQ
jgi:hypothetical protein